MESIRNDASLPIILEEAAVKWPSKIALSGGEQDLTYFELRRKATALALFLTHRGVQRGDRVMFLIENSTNFAVFLWAVHYAGAVAVPLSPETAPEKLSWLIHHCSPTMVIIDISLKEKFRDTSVASSLSWSNEIVEAVSSLSTSLPVTTCSPVSSDLACIIYTSGSTGFPKGVALSHHNMMAALGSVSAYLKLRHDDKILCALPFSFDYGLYQIFLSAKAGATLLIERSFAQPFFVLKTIARLGVTVLPIVPTMVALITPFADRFNLSSVRLITSTGSPLYQEAIDALALYFPSAALYSMYGVTECHRCTYLHPRDLLTRRTSVGKAIPNTELGVVTDEGTWCDQDAIGELVIRGPTVMVCYWNDVEATNERLRFLGPQREKVLFTGDICRIDSDGFVYFVARKDDILKIKGEKVAPKEVESMLMRHQDVLESAVIGAAHPVLGDQIIAFYTTHPDRKLSSILMKKWCTKNLPSIMRPREIYLLDSMPKSCNGKIDKIALKQQWENEHSFPSVDMRCGEND